MELHQLSKHQKKSLQQFSEAFRDCAIQREEFFLKWLQACNFNVKNAEGMLRESLEWRRENKVDEILSWKPPKVLLNYLPIDCIGYDRCGGPVWINAYGRADSRGIFQSVSREDYLRYFVYLAEQNGKHLEELQQINDSKKIRRIVRETAIVDLEGLSMYQLSYKPVREVGIELTKMLQANYPDNLRRIFIINASKLFTISFALIKPFLGQETLDKFAIYGYDKEEWKAALLDEIAADQLPVHYGGTMTDPDGNPLCLTKICMGGEVPTKYYSANKKSMIADDDVESLVIPARTKKTYEFDVRAVNSMIRWEFLIEKADVGFCVYRLDGDHRVDVVPYRLFNAETGSVTGQLICTNTTTCSVLLFLSSRFDLRQN